MLRSKEATLLSLEDVSRRRQQHSFFSLSVDWTTNFTTQKLALAMIFWKKKKKKIFDFLDPWCSCSCCQCMILLKGGSPPPTSLAPSVRPLARLFVCLRFSRTYSYTYVRACVCMFKKFWLARCTRNAQNPGCLLCAYIFFISWAVFTPKLNVYSYTTC